MWKHILHLIEIFCLIVSFCTFFFITPMLLIEWFSSALSWCLSNVIILRSANSTHILIYMAFFKFNTPSESTLLCVQLSLIPHTSHYTLYKCIFNISNIPSIDASIDFIGINKSRNKLYVLAPIAVMNIDFCFFLSSISFARKYDSTLSL